MARLAFMQGLISLLLMVQARPQYESPVWRNADQLKCATARVQFILISRVCEWHSRGCYHAISGTANPYLLCRHSPDQLECMGMHANIQQ